MNLRNPILATLIMPTLAISLSACQNKTSANIANSSSNQTGAEQHDHGAHEHKDLEVTSLGTTTAIPSVRFSIEPDRMSGWNIKIDTDNFDFAPQNVNSDPVAGEGHAHVYVDDFKIARLYGNWFHLKRLTPGEHVVRITLNANDHSSWSHQGQPIEATRTVTQP